MLSNVDWVCGMDPDWQPDSFAFPIRIPTLVFDGELKRVVNKHPLALKGRLQKTHLIDDWPSQFGLYFAVVLVGH